MVIIWCAAAQLSIDSGVLIPTCTCAKVMSCSRQAGRQDFMTLASGVSTPY